MDSIRKSLKRPVKFMSNGPVSMRLIFWLGNRSRSQVTAQAPPVFLQACYCLQMETACLDQTLSGIIRVAAKGAR